MVPAPQSDDILELTDIVEGDGKKSGDAMAEASDADFEQELEDLFAEELGEAAPTGEAEPVILDDPAGEDEAEGSGELVDDADEEPLVLDEVADDGASLLLDEVADDEVSLNSVDDAGAELLTAEDVEDNDDPLELGADLEVAEEISDDNDHPLELGDELLLDDVVEETDEEPLELSAELEMAEASETTGVADTPGDDDEADSDDIDLDGLEDVLGDPAEASVEDDGGLDALLEDVSALDEDQSFDNTAVNNEANGDGDELDAIELDDLVEEGPDADVAVELDTLLDDATSNDDDASDVAEAGPTQDDAVGADSLPDAESAEDDIDVLIADVGAQDDGLEQTADDVNQGAEEEALDALLNDDAPSDDSPAIEGVDDSHLAELGGASEDDSDDMDTLLADVELDVSDIVDDEDDGFDLEESFGRDMASDAMVGEALIMRLDMVESRLARLEGSEGSLSPEGRMDRIEDMLMKSGASHELELASRVDALEKSLGKFKDSLRNEVVEALREYISDEARSAVAEVVAEAAPDVGDTSVEEGLKALVRAEVAAAVPVEAARIIREEIAALMNEMGE